MMAAASTASGPRRTCAGCRQADAPEDLVRVVAGPDGSIAVDAKGGAFGRGAWVHARRDCVARAAERGLSKSFRSAIRVTPSDLAKAIALAADRRVVGLLGSAVRAKKLAAGTSGVEAHLERGDVELLVVARDAQAAADRPGARALVAEGRAVPWGTKERLGDAVGRGVTGVVAILDTGLANAVRGAVFRTQIQDQEHGA